jgi:fumarylpyruvate hydrolase
VLDSIRNVFCIGRNYKLHAAELGNDVPSAPMVFSKPTHALAHMEGQAIALPGDRGELHYEAELVVRIGSNYDPKQPQISMIDGLALGVDFTLRSVQDELKQLGHPWLKAKGFKNSAPITEFIPFPGLAALTKEDFTLQINGSEKQRGNMTDMIFDLQTILVYCETHFGLGEGDIIFTGTPAGVGAVRHGDVFEVSLGSSLKGTFSVHLN